MFSGKKASILTIDDDKRAADAMRYVETGHVPGKVVLTVDR